jgi:hypothetical protein
MHTKTTIAAIATLVVTTAAVAFSIGMISTIPSALAQGNQTAGGGGNVTAGANMTGGGGNMTAGGGNMTSSSNATK